MRISTLSSVVAVCTFALAVAWAGRAASHTYINSQNCPNGSTWGSLPAEYKINDQGSDDMSFSKTEQMVKDSYAEWESPCCSTFRTNYLGTTTKTALDSRRNRRIPPILSWIESRSNWPQYLGNPNRVLGVTLAAFSRCRIVDAPIVFNGVKFTYRPAGSTDLQSIATHEIGHYLGLGHSSASGDPTMAPRYLGGTKQRTIESDDEKGLCSLYGGGTCNCSGDSDCQSGQTCNANGKCEDVPCRDDSECPDNQECNMSTGNCRVPPCNSDSDCTKDGYICDSGTCVPKCSICASCTQNSDCGADSTYLCAETRSGNGICLKSCSRGGCPGDSECTGVSTRRGTFDICLNPGACPEQDRRGTLCPSEYTCGEGQVVYDCQVDPDGGGDDDAGMDADTDDADASVPMNDTGSSEDQTCVSFEKPCDPDRRGTCGPQADTCDSSLFPGSQPRCSCTCSSDSDCGEGAACETVSERKWCVPADQPDAGSSEDVSITRANASGGNAQACYCGTTGEPALPVGGAALFATALVALRRRNH